nr:glycosyltransferase [uncultured Lichenicoccus sp.]
MKWYFCVTADTLTANIEQDFPDMIRVAVASAFANTDLQPHMVFDGEECGFTREMAAAGVKVIFRRLSFYAELRYAQRRLLPYLTQWMTTAAGAFMRLDIPRIEFEDEFVLYTDCDVVFLQNPDLGRFRPTTFAAASQFDLYGHDFRDAGKQNYAELNSGVMLMNVDRMRRDLPALIDLTCDMLHTFRGYDQSALEQFYMGQWTPLSPKYNWKPYWAGIDPYARIIHFHGPKPRAVLKLLADGNYRIDDETFQEWRGLFWQNPEAYRHYTDAWSGFLDAARSNVS